MLHDPLDIIERRGREVNGGEGNSMEENRMDGIYLCLVFAYIS